MSIRDRRFFSALLCAALAVAACDTSKTAPVAPAPPEPVAKTAEQAVEPTVPDKRADPVTPTVDVKGIPDIKSYLGASPEKIETLEGTPNKCRESKGFNTCKYRDRGALEITYIQGKADWVVFYARGALPFDGTALEKLGFAKPGEPKVGNDKVLRWDGHDATVSISLFPIPPDAAKTDYVRVKAFTK